MMMLDAVKYAIVFSIASKEKSEGRRVSSPLLARQRKTQTIVITSVLRLAYLP
jgi:hypothetical protein